MSTYLSNKIKNISFLLSILVVILHAYNLEQNANININSFFQKFISYGICTIAVPFFFIVSGFLMFYKFEPTLRNWIAKYKKRFKTLAVPFVIWCAGWMIVLYLVQMVPLGKSLFTNMMLGKFSLSQIIKYTFIYPIPFQLWYIRSLILCVIISPLIYYVIKFIGKISVVILLVLWFFNIISFPIALFSFGCFLAIENINLEFSSNKVLNFILCISFVLALILKTYLSYYDYYGLSYLEKLVIALGGLSLWMGFDKFNCKEVISIAQYGIFIYFFHEPLQSMIIRIVFKIIRKSEITQLILYLSAPSVTILVCLLVGMLLKKHTNKFYCLLTGGR